MPQMHGQLMDVMPEPAPQDGSNWKQYRENQWGIIATATAIVYLFYSLGQYASLNSIPLVN